MIGITDITRKSKNLQQTNEKITFTIKEHGAYRVTCISPINSALNCDKIKDNSNQDTRVISMCSKQTHSLVLLPRP